MWHSACSTENKASPNREINSLNLYFILGELLEETRCPLIYLFLCVSAGFSSLIPTLQYLSEIAKRNTTDIQQYASFPEILWNLWRSCSETIWLPVCSTLDKVIGL